MKKQNPADSALSFIFPIDGDCLNPYDGAQTDEGLAVTVRVRAPADAEILVNGRTAVFQDDCHLAVISLQYGGNTLVAQDKNDPSRTAGIRVCRIRNSVGGYRLSLDDNILFLQDLHINRARYSSLFDNPYLRLLRKAHRLYGAKVHINIYYEYNSAAAADFSEHKQPFNLTMMTDQYRPEWQANADWLRLSFHARANYPDKPYAQASYEQLDADIRQVHREIERFAGPELLEPATTLHWGAAAEDGVRALRANGYRFLCGSFRETPDGQPLVTYHCPLELARHIRSRDFWQDHQLGVTFSKLDLILNLYPLGRIIPELEAIKSDPHRAGFLELIIHEEYYYPDYVATIPEFEQIVLTACRWARDNNYRGQFLSELELD